MKIAQNTAPHTGTVIAPEGASRAVSVLGHTRRDVGALETGEPAVVVEIDFETDVALDVPGRYMVELDAGDTVELDVVYGVPLADGRFYFKGLALDLNPA